MQREFQAKTAKEWIQAFSEADLLATPVNDYADLLDDPQVASNYVDYLQPPEGDRLPIVGIPVVFGKTPGHAKSMAPEFGQHTEEVLLEAGLDWPEILALREEGAIGVR
jgi:formyl-CoA transferase